VRVSVGNRETEGERDRERDREREREERRVGGMALSGYITDGVVVGVRGGT